MGFVNLKIVGTSHIAPESKKRIIGAFNEFGPDIICVELDANRLAGLKKGGSRRVGLSAIRDVGVIGYLFASIGGYIQKKLGNITGMSPGDEMLLASSLAEDNGLRLELIDRDVRFTLKKISKIPLKERFRIVWDFISAPFKRGQRVKINIGKIPEEGFVKKLTAQLKDRYPYIYRVVIDERNKFMAKKIFLLMRDNPDKRILVVVGEGHVEGIKDYLKKLEQDNVSFISYSSA